MPRRTARRTSVATVASVGAVRALVATALFASVLLASVDARAQDDGAAAPPPAPVDTDGDGVTEDLEAAADATDDPVEVIISFDGDVSPSTEPILEYLVGDLGATKDLELIDAVSAELDAGQIERLAELAGPLDIVKISPDYEITAASVGQAGGDAGELEASALLSGHTGAGTTAAVLDSGINPGHSELDGGKVVGFFDAQAGFERTAFDDSTTGHGSHVASILAGDTIGAAPQARLVGVKVLDALDKGKISDLVDGLGWVVANRSRFDISVVNISVQGKVCTDGTDSGSQAVNAAVAAGLFVTVAAGNKSVGSGTPCTITIPAVATSATAVGASATSSTLLSFSSRGPTADGRIKPDITAPGLNVNGANPLTGGFTTKSGTSMAAPYVAGLGLLVKAANPGSTGSAIRSTVLGTAVDKGPAGKDNGWGFGLANPASALPSAPPPPPGVSPIGSLDAVGPAPGGAAVSGWALHPGSSSTALVQIRNGSTPLKTVAANTSRPDVAAVFGTDANHGFNTTVALPPGTHDICADALPTGGGAPVPLGCRTFTYDGAPIGNLDLAVATTGGVRVSGWAVDPDSTGSVTIHIYDGPTLVKITTANTSRPDVAAALGVGSNHGYRATIAVGPGVHQICAFAVDIAGTQNRQLGCRDYVATGDPVGVFDRAIRAGAGKVRLTGWVFDPDTTSPVQLHIYAGPNLVRLATASVNRPDVAAFFEIDPNHGYDDTFTLGPGTHTVCVFGINRSGPGTNPQLGCKTVTL